MSVHARTIAVFPWFKGAHGLVFWQAVWFLYFQDTLSAAEAVLLYAVYDVAATVLEVPSGYMSDRIGRRATLVGAALAGLGGGLALATGDSFAAFALGQILLGASTALLSGTDSAILYEALVAENRAEEVEAQELRAWRFSFGALAVSAVTGGALGMLHPVAPFWAGVLAFLAMLALALRLAEPPHQTDAPSGGSEAIRLTHLKKAMLSPVLAWLFVLSVVMYAFSHVPFVFGQPFILSALDRMGLAGEAPLVSGAVSTTMMLLSLAVSLAAPGIRRMLGLAGVLLLAFGMQIGLIAVLALTNAPIAIAILFLRMVPDSLSRPFILARIQPELNDDSRATYLSLKSLLGRLLFAGTLFLAAGASNDVGAMSFGEIQWVLWAYVALGLTIWAGLLVALRRLRLEPGA